MAAFLNFIGTIKTRIIVGLRLLFFQTFSTTYRAYSAPYVY